jgi:hypothetical protein
VLVHGDHNERADPNERLIRLGRQVDRVSRMAAGIERHAALVGILVEAGQLQQGLADAAFAEQGEDRRSPVTEGLGQFLLQLAASVRRSWDSQFGRVGQLPGIPSPICRHREVDLRLPEGFAFYAVYPEAYLEAARRLSLAAPPRVIGIRSIGTTLGAVVSAALDAPAPATVRPHGDPFARKLAVAPELERELLAGTAHYVIVDEGPGLSGSSFGAVADWLQDRGVPVERIAFVPSHAGAPGPKASERHLQRWAQIQRGPALFDDLPRLLRDWVLSLTGQIDGPLANISAGEWRRWRYSSETQWPAVNPAWERRKFLASAGGERFMIKFAGLGPIGERKLGMARALFRAGFTPEPIGLVHGFLVERWYDDSKPLMRGDKPIARIAQYIGSRATLFPAKLGDGASFPELLEMARRNLSLAHGGHAAKLVGGWEPRLDRLSNCVVPVRTDNRLLPHEWLRFSGRVVKTDALDHHSAHDLIGCQDMAWDVAGAIAEFELDECEASRLVDMAERCGGRRVDPELLGFYRLAYLAFRIGQAQLSADSCPSAAERRRLLHEADRYCSLLEHLLPEHTRTATRPISSVG